ncbi:MAG: SIR2 family NAD-dependent protein deacylase [Ruminiclostridium sp.]
MLVASGYREEIEKIIRKRFRKLEPSNSFKKIAAIPWKAIYTTNYDDIIEKSYEKQEYYQLIKEDIENPGYSYNDNNIPFFKLHGDITKEFDENCPLVITMTDLKKSKIKNEKIISRLAEELNDTFVFVGYSFEDKLITDILDSFMATSRWESIKEKYVVSPSISEDDALQMSIYNIHHIKATADEFFEYLNARSESDYRAN